MLIDNAVSARATGMSVLFVRLLHVPWPPSLLGDALPLLRAASGRSI